jgi:membrane protease YdiL (CAAX protease family)
MQQTGCIGHSRSRAAAEIGFVVLCVLIAEWAVIPIFGRNKKIGMIPIAAVLIFSFLSHRTRRESAREIGFTGKNFLGAFRLLLPWMIPASALLIAAGWTLGSLHYSGPRSWGAIALSQFWLFLWGLMQQYALQAIVNRRAQEIWRKGWLSTMAAALIFAVLHLPNVWLTTATLAAGVLWASVYQRTPNLFALAISHSLMTSVLACSISPAVLHGMRVGYNYF